MEAVGDVDDELPRMERAVKLHLVSAMLLRPDISEATAGSPHHYQGQASSLLRNLNVEITTDDSCKVLSRTQKRHINCCSTAARFHP